MPSQADLDTPYSARDREHSREDVEVDIQPPVDLAWDMQKTQRSGANIPYCPPFAAAEGGPHTSPGPGSPQEGHMLAASAEAGFLDLNTYSALASSQFDSCHTHPVPAADFA
jgi:hypothetical protein